MKQDSDKFTIDMLAPPKRGARPVLHKQSANDRQAARRERLKREGRGFLTAEVSVRILEELTRRNKATKVDKNKIVENILNAALFGADTQEQQSPAQGAETA